MHRSVHWRERNMNSARSKNEHTELVPDGRRRDLAWLRTGATHIRVMDGPTGEARGLDEAFFWSFI